MANSIVVSELIKIKALKLNAEKPFTWASGWRSPIYCDNRKTLSYPIVRRRICEGFKNIINDHFSDVNVVAGVATGAIAHGALVAWEMDLPFVYVRSSPKQHGLENLVEGEIQPGQKVVVVEDLISTGMSSLAAVKALRNAGCEVLGMVAIFTYEFDRAKENFERDGVKLFTLSSYSELISYALETGAVKPHEVEMLKSWRENPESWGK
jgi:orotate phosphoribosyltransferase